MSSKKQCASTRKATKQGTKCKGVCLFWTEWERRDSQWGRVLKQDSQRVGGSACIWQGCSGRHPSPAALSPPPHVYSQQPVGWPLLPSFSFHRLLTMDTKRWQESYWRRVPTPTSLTNTIGPPFTLRVLLNLLPHCESPSLTWCKRNTLPCFSHIRMI